MILLPLHLDAEHVRYLDAMAALAGMDRVALAESLLIAVLTGDGKANEGTPVGRAAVPTVVAFPRVAHPGA